MSQAYDYSGFGAPYGSWAAGYRDVKVFLRGAVMTVMLSRPEALNGMSHRLNVELIDAFRRINDDPAARVVILTGDPQCRIFSAGADFGAGQKKKAGGGGGGGSAPKAAAAPPTGGVWAGAESQKWDYVMRHRDEGGVISVAIHCCRKPVIAAITGSAVGGGLTPTLACDIRLVADDAKLGFVFARRGIVPEGCSSYFLPRLVGQAKALEWTLRGHVFPAREAEGTGLFNRLLPREQVYAEALRMAEDIAANCAPASLSLIKAMISRGPPADPQEANLLESRLLAWSFKQHDSSEGVLSFLQKRPAKFTNKGELPESFPWWREPDITSRL